MPSPLMSRFKRERTVAAVKVASQTFNAPGVYQPKYGKMTLLVSGRGTSGNSPTPGTVAYYNPSTPGNLAGYNSYEPGNVAGYNPPTSQLEWTSYGSQYWSTYQSSTGWFDENFNSWESGGTGPAPAPVHQSNFSNGGGAQWQTFYSTYDVVYSSSGYVTVPGSEYYNPGTPGGAYYNSPIPGNAVYNPPVTGVAGSTSNVLGVTFPGGAIGSTAPVVGDTLTKVAYSNSPVNITVPVGGYVVIKEK